MERNDVIKALECCNSDHTCIECPYCDDCYDGKVCDNALVLIRELTEENERLRAICTDLIRNSQTEQVNLLLYIRSKAEIFYNSVGVSFLAVDVADIDRIRKEKNRRC